MRFELAPDLLLALAAVEDDEVLEQPLLVVVEGLDLDRAPGPAARRLEAMTVSIGPGPDVLHRRPLRLIGPPDHERDDASAVEEHEPANRAREDQVAFAVLEIRVPAHLLREREVAQHAAHHVGEHVHRGLAALFHAIREVLAFRCLLPLERGHVHAVLLREACGGRRRLAVRLVCRGHRRTSDQLFEVRLTLGDANHARGEAAWRAVGLGRRVARQPRLFQACVYVLRHLRGEARQPAGRDLLAANLDQQLAVHRY